MSKLLIKQWNRNLVIHSNVINVYPGLKNLLNKHNTVSEELVNDCIDMDSDTQEILKTGAYKEIISSAEKEWIAQTNNDTDNSGKVKCNLCNHHTKNLYYIRNVENGEVLNVGSECILHFQNLKNENGVNMSEYIEEVKKAKRELDKKVSKTAKINSRFVNLEARLDACLSKINNSQYLVNYDLYNQVTSSIETIIRIKDKYILGQMTASCFSDIDKRLLLIDRIVSNDIPRCNKELSKKKYACTKEIADWLMRSNNKGKELTLRRIRLNNSCFSSDTIIEISYLPFVREHLKDYIDKTKDIFYDIRLVSEGGSSELYVNIRNEFLGEIAFYCTPNQFMKKLGDIVFLDEKGCHQKFSLDYLFTNVLLLYDDEDNIYRLYTKLNREFRFAYEFLYDYDLNITYIVDKKSGLYTQFDGTRRVVLCILKHFENNYISNQSYKKRCENAISKNFSWVKLSDSMIKTINKCRREFNNTEYV